MLEDIDALGGVAMIAHPDSPRPEFRWTQWEIPGAWGIELLNGDTQWRSIGAIDTMRLLTTYPLNPIYALLGILHRPDSTLERWDRLLATRENPKWTIGDSVPADPRPRLLAGGALPERAMVTLYRDGGVIKKAANELEWPNATAGVYRVEVRLPGWDMPWILSNAISVLDPAVQDARQRRGRVPPPVVAETAQVLDDFETGGRFEPASDTSTTLDRIATLPDAGDRGSVARLRFTLGTPTTAIPSPFAALVNL